MGDVPDAPEVDDAPRAPKRGVLKRILIGLGITVAVLAGLALFLYAFGTMEPPKPEMRAAFAQMVAAGQAEPVPGRFHVPVPGCRCHSRDPALQAQHSVRYVRECVPCHSGR